jgi:hypothetical protein
MTIVSGTTLTPTLQTTTGTTSYDVTLTCDDGVNTPSTDVMVLDTFASASGTEEARCTALGSFCTCSEPLDTTAPHFTSNGLLFADPSDSGSNECAGENGDGASWYKDTRASPQPESDAEYNMPAGNTVTTVWRNTGSAGISHIVGNTPSTNTRRMCVRHYFNLSSDYEGAVSGSGCGANKTIELAVGGSMLHGSQARSPTKWELGAYSFTNTGPVKNLNRSGSLELDDCREEWCRIEVCLSGNFATRTDMFGEGRMVRASDGKTMTFIRMDLGDATGGPVKKPWIANMFRQADPPGNCAGDRAFSHAMQAEWPTDADQWIGRASEIGGF